MFAYFNWFFSHSVQLGQRMANGCWLLRAQVWRGRRESDFQVFCHRNQLHRCICAGISTETLLHHVRTTTTTLRSHFGSSCHFGSSVQ